MGARWRGSAGRAARGVTPVEETLAALTDLVRAGKVRYVGCSKLDAWQVADADWTARTGGHERFVSAQNRYSLLDRRVEDELVPACEAFGLGLPPYFALAYGLLAGGGSTRAGRSGWRAPTGTGSTRWRRTPRSAASRCWTWPSPDSPLNRPWAR